MPAMKLYVARHGQTQWNLENKILGRTDLPLTEVGKAQAEILADRVSDLELDLIISSPMRRAMETAGAVANRYHLPVLTDERLIEQDFGIYEGQHHKVPDYLENKRQFAYRYPGGESGFDVAHRVYGFLEELKEKYPSQRILVVCHRCICRIIRTYFEDMTNEAFLLYAEENCAVREYEL